MRGATCFSGIGAPEVAMPWVDWLWHSEIEPFPCAVMAERHPLSENLGDILAADFIERAKAMGPLDIMVGGPPCQAFSIAGLRQSLADPRGNLSLRWVQVLHAIRPHIAVTENVPGWLSTSDNAFGCFLAGVVGADAPLNSPLERGRWPSHGMVDGPLARAAWRILDAQFVRVGEFPWAVPQRRRRVFVVIDFGTGGIDPAAVLFDRESLLGNSAPCREAGERTAGTLSARTQGGGGLGTDFDLDGGQAAVCDWPAAVAPTLDSHFGDKMGLENQHVDGGDCLSPPVANGLTARMHKGINTTLDEGQTLIPSLGGGFDEGVAHTLSAEGFDASEDGTGRGTPLVPVPHPPEIAGTRKACGGKSGLPNGAEEADRMVAVAFTAKDYGADAMEDTSPTLRAGAHSTSHQNGGVMPAVAFDMRGREGGAMPEGPHRTANLRAADGGSSRSYVAHNWQVRRLTPVECHRLQGFPDHHCRIAWRGKPPEKCPDGPQYRALGNSMAVNVVSWIGHRIRTVTKLNSEQEA